MADLFAAPSNWRDAFIETLGYVTDIITAEDDSEQRIMLRNIPTSHWSFLVTALDSREMGILETLLWDGQGKEWIVPYWPHQTRLAEDAIVGAINSFLPVISRTDLDFIVGDYAIFGDQFGNMEAVLITDFFGGTVRTVAPSRVWPKGTSVVPGRVGVLTESLEIPHPNGAIAESHVTFEIVTTIIVGMPGGESGASGA